MKSEDELHALHALTVLTIFNAQSFAALGSPTHIDRTLGCPAMRATLPSAQTLTGIIL